MILDIDSAIADKRLLGAALGDLQTWRTWRVVLKAAFALPLDASETETFKQVAGGRNPPRKRVGELWCVVGRRGGKSRMAATISTYLSTFGDAHKKLSPGETGYVLALSASKSQATLVKNYCEGHFVSSAILHKQLVQPPTATEISLRDNITISIHTNDYRSVRGRTLLGATFDEVSFWRDENSASPDLEVYRAVLPALASTGGMLVAISSPYRKLGLLYQKYEDHFGRDSDDILVVQGATELFNPSIDRSIIERARENDPLSAVAEWDGFFRGDLSSLLDDEFITRAVNKARPLELAPDRKHQYFCFADPSGGRHDSFTIAIGHSEGGRVICDLVRGHKPPFNPEQVAKEYATLARQYSCAFIETDNYSAEWVASSFTNAGIKHQRCEMPRSGLYLEALPVFLRGGIEIPDHKVLIRELRMLERRTGRSGRDSVDHPQNGTDDHSNSLAGLIRLCSKPQIVHPTAYQIKASLTGGRSPRYGTTRR